MPVAGTPGQQAASLFGQADVNSGTLFGQAQGFQNPLASFFTNQMQNPQGLGATTLSQLLTQGGQSTAGALGGANRTATDLASRTGNLSAIPEITGMAGKAGMEQQSNMATALGIMNEKEKRAQQSQGVAGLSGLYGQDLGAAQGYAGLADKAIGTRIQASQAAHANLASDISDVGKVIGMATGGLGGVAGLMGGGGNMGSQLFSQAGGGAGADSLFSIPTEQSALPDQL